MRQHISIKELMSRPAITAPPTELVRDALHRMHGADIRHLPIVDRTGTLIGVLSERDAYRAFLQSRDLSIAVAAVMTKDVLTVREESRASEATALMLDHKIGCVPVVGEKMELVGIVTETDFLRLAHEFLHGDALVDTMRSSFA
jgi:CBS domain-containing protein